MSSYSRTLSSISWLQPSAFAAKADRGVLLSRPLPALDALVDVANRRLVCAGALLPLALHDWDPLTPIAPAPAA